MARQAIVILVVVAAFGIFVPLYKGFGFLDARIIAAYACLSLFFVAPASAELSGAQAVGTPASATLAKLALIVAWGWGIALLILATAIVTLNLIARRGGFYTPPLGFLAAVLTFSLTASFATGMLATLLGRRFSAAAVKTILRTGFLVILLLLVFGSRVLPERVQFEILDQFATRRALTRLAWDLSVILAAISAVLLLLLIRMQRPNA